MVYGLEQVLAKCNSNVSMIPPRYMEKLVTLALFMAGMAGGTESFRQDMLELLKDHKGLGESLQDL